MEGGSNDNDSMDLAAGISAVRGRLVVPVPADLPDDTVRLIQSSIIERLEGGGNRAVLFDFSAVPVLDTFSFRTFVATAKMTSLLGAESIFVGLRPGVVCALIDLDLDCGTLDTAPSLEDAFRRLDTIEAMSASTEETQDAHEEESNEEPCDE